MFYIVFESAQLLSLSHGAVHGDKSCKTKGEQIGLYFFGPDVVIGSSMIRPARTGISVNPLWLTGPMWLALYN